MPQHAWPQPAEQSACIASAANGNRRDGLPSVVCARCAHRLLGQRKAENIVGLLAHAQVGQYGFA